MTAAPATPFDNPNRSSSPLVHSYCLVYSNGFGDLISLCIEWFPIDRLCTDLGTTEIWGHFHISVDRGRIIITFIRVEEQNEISVIGLFYNEINGEIMRVCFNWVTSGILVPSLSMKWLLRRIHAL